MPSGILRYGPRSRLLGDFGRWVALAGGRGNTRSVRLAHPRLGIPVFSSHRSRRGGTERLSASTEAWSANTDEGNNAALPVGVRVARKVSPLPPARGRGRGRGGKLALVGALVTLCSCLKVPVVR